MLDSPHPDAAARAEQGPGQRSDLEQQIIELIRGVKEIPAEELTAATVLADLGVDSLDALNILFAIEEHSHIIIPDERAREIRTFGDVIETVRALTGAPSSQ
jgi:acyl carrier protein